MNKRILLKMGSGITRKRTERASHRGWLPAQSAGFPAWEASSFATCCWSAWVIALRGGCGGTRERGVAAGIWQDALQLRFESVHPEKRLFDHDLASVAPTVCTSLSVVLSILGILLDQHLQKQPKSSERRTARGEGACFPRGTLLVTGGSLTDTSRSATCDMVLKRPAFLWVFVL
uniref:Uncharacterized protein n=1 Tax=Pipistrellus kuhlii TaxID=59472 RepID=A0A7J7UGF7_PIPKU|nr:hypothetical protein mPipKuh1_009079 [Pipistrellus kuhlii]